MAAADGHMRTLYQTTKMLTGKFGRAEVPVKDKNGKVVFGEEEQKTRWKEHFEELLNRPAPADPPIILPARNDLPIKVDLPSSKEIP